MKNLAWESRPRKRRPAALAAALLAAVLFSPAPLRADCLVTYADCVNAAAEENSFWRRSAGGLRCYIEFISCLQRRLA